MRRLVLTPLILSAAACASTNEGTAVGNSFFDLVSSQPVEVASYEEPATPAWNPPHMKSRNVRGHRQVTFKFEEDGIYDIDVGPPGTIVTLRFGRDEVVEPKATSGDAGEVPANGGGQQTSIATGWGVQVRKAGGRSVAAIAVGDDALPETTLVFFSDQRVYQINTRRVSAAKRMHVVDWVYPPKPSRPRPQLASACQIDTAGINVDYTIQSSGDTLPVWAPIAVGTNGRKTWLGYAGDIGSIGPAPLFVTDSGRAVAGITPRRCGQRFLEYDGTFSSAEMRRGTDVVTLGRIAR